MSPLWKLIVLALFLWSAANTWQQLDQANRFIQQGQRFTAQDGQALCERVQALEKTPQPCRYKGQ